MFGIEWLRRGVPIEKETSVLTSEPEAIAALERAAEALRKAGHGVSDLPTPHSLQNLPRLQRLVMAYDMERALAYERLVHESRLSSILKTLLAKFCTP